MSDLKAFRKDALKAHNEMRKKHGVPPLKLNDAINDIAQRYAESIASKDTFAHSKPQDRQHEGKQMGENLAMKWTSTGDDFPGSEATGNWYAEIEKYDFKAGSGPGTGHFTQVVWKSSELLGIGKAQTKGGKWLVCANYYPAGNFVGRYLENVLPPVSGKVEVPAKAPSPSAGKKISKGKPAPKSNGGGHKAGTHTSTRTERTKTRDGRTITKTITTVTTTDASGNKSVKTSTKTVES